jgi:hypothetical protein
LRGGIRMSGSDDITKIIVSFIRGHSKKQNSKDELTPVSKIFWGFWIVIGFIALISWAQL